MVFKREKDKVKNNNNRASGEAERKELSNKNIDDVVGLLALSLPVFYFHCLPT